MMAKALKVGFLRRENAFSSTLDHRQKTGSLPVSPAGEGVSKRHKGFYFRLND
jgi:hypothetical protein